jgi:hypothetical protein
MSSRASDTCGWRMSNESWDGENATICSYRNLQFNNRVVSPPSRIVGQEECYRANNSLMVRQTERHALCRVTLRDKPHSSILDSYSFAQRCNLIQSGKREEDQRVRQQHMVNVVTTTVPTAIHKRPSHSRVLQRSHPKAPDNEGLQIPEGITMRRYATAR